MASGDLSAGQRLKQAREAAGLTLAALAERMGATRQGISNVENGRPARLDWIYRAAVAIGCKPSDLDPRLTDRIEPGDRPTPAWRCNECNRKGVPSVRHGSPCGMIQPDGSRCRGVMTIPDNAE